jgi:C1A family cysteine protease
MSYNPDFKRFYNVQIQHLTLSDDKYLSFDTSLSSTSPSFDLSKNMNLIYNQGNIGSCTANALAWALKYRKRNVNPSRLYLYYYSRYFDYQQGDNRPSIDDGTTLEQGVNVLRRKGVCDESLYPYRTHLHGRQPPTYLNKNAITNRVLRYSFVRQNMDAMKACLNSGYPFVFGFLVYSSFENPSVDKTGIIPIPNTSTESLLGGHAVIAVGYDDSKQLIKFANSWGRGWGENGYGYIPYSYILNPSWTDDFWVLYDINLKKKKKINQLAIRSNPINYALYLRKKQSHQK